VRGPTLTSQTLLPAGLRHGRGFRANIPAMRGRRLIAVAAVLAALPFAAGSARAFTEIKHAPQPHEATNEEIIEYYESGAHARDTKVIGQKARRGLRREVARHDGHRKPAIVFDIDDTALSNYQCERDQGDFGSTELVGCIVGAGAETAAGTGRGLPVIEPVYNLFRKARLLDVDVFFITGRPLSAREASIQNLRVRGYSRPWELTTYPSLTPATGISLIPYKSGERAEIEREGHEILVNIGDQRSDLKGGHANRKYLVPNPMYLTP
jgi:predicted secreted acid phosphatase